jgi:hypothetical protein
MNETGVFEASRRRTPTSSPQLEGQVSRTVQKAEIGETIPDTPCRQVKFYHLPTIKWQF